MHQYQNQADMDYEGHMEGVLGGGMVGGAAFQMGV